MLRIRLRRVGKKGKPSYRIVVADANAPRDGAYVEWIGTYDPMADPPAVSIKNDRAVQWLSQGAQPSDPVQRILDREGIMVRTPKYRTHTESSAVTPAPAVTVTTVPVTVATEEDSEVPEEVMAEETAEEATDEATDVDVVEEVVAEETAEQATDEEDSGDASEDETEDEAR